MISLSYKNWFALVLIGFTLITIHACSSESNAPLNKAFHNTTAHYNSYFIGLERIREVEEAIWKGMKPDYNYILKIYPPLDSTMATTYKAQLDDCIKKASIVIQYHQNSKWVDDSYNLIGQARMYGYDFPNAITTFKYVNTQGEDVNAKHWAIVNLMRTFIENGELSNAVEASDYLESEILNKNNLKHLYLTRAYYYQVIDDKDKMVRNLVSADPLLSRSERARFYFIIGQVYQEIGFSAAAYEYYKKCISSNPKYELAFYAKLNIAQVTELGDSRDLKKVRKYFNKLVKDEKNVEFQDRIYYEWGKFELKQGNLDEAIVKFNLSVSNSVSDPRQKGVSYLSLGEIYYDSLKDYPNAEAYYDSAVTILPKTYEHYITVKHRQEVLTEFIAQINTIYLQDSLLNLANMDSATVMNIFITRATAERDAEEQAAAFAEKQQKNQTVSITTFDGPTGIGASNWYFSNSSAVGAGRTSFRQSWGSRVLEDHWRRSVKLSVVVNDENVLDPEDDEGVEEAKTELSRDQAIMYAANGMYNQLPLTEEAKIEAHEALEQAYYTLGKIYYFDLFERDNAIIAFATLHEDYPASEYTAETYYLLYLIYQELEDSDKVEEIDEYMHSNMPNSIYTKLIDNPQYKELSSQANEVLAKEYRSIYNLYLNDELDTANRIITVLLELHPDVNFSANLRLLQILIIGKTHPLADYQLALQSFIEQYPDHELNAYAKELLDASSTYLNRLVKLKAAEYFVSSTDEYFFVVLSLNNEPGKQNELLLEPLVNSSFKDKELEIGSLVLNDSINMTLVQPFATKADALLFFDTTKADQLFDDLKKPNFVISKSNFDILYKSKEIDAYMEFFREHF